MSLFSVEIAQYNMLRMENKIRHNCTVKTFIAIFLAASLVTESVMAFTANETSIFCNLHAALISQPCFRSQTLALHPGFRHFPDLSIVEFCLTHLREKTVIKRSHALQQWITAYSISFLTLCAQCLLAQGPRQSVPTHIDTFDLVMLGFWSIVILCGIGLTAYPVYERYQFSQFDRRLRIMEPQLLIDTNNMLLKFPKIRKAISPHFLSRHAIDILQISMLCKNPYPTQDFGLRDFRKAYGEEWIDKHWTGLTQILAICPGHETMLLESLVALKNVRGQVWVDQQWGMLVGMGIAYDLNAPYLYGSVLCQLSSILTNQNWVQRSRDLLRIISRENPTYVLESGLRHLIQTVRVRLIDVHWDILIERAPAGTLFFEGVCALAPIIRGNHLEDLVPVLIQEAPQEAAHSNAYYNYLSAWKNIMTVDNLAELCHSHATFVNTLGNSSLRDPLFRLAIPALEGVITQENMQQIQNDLLALGKDWEQDSRRLYQSIGALRNEFGAAWVKEHWPGLIQMGLAAGESCPKLFNTGLAQLKREYGLLWIDNHWDTLVKMATTTNGQSTGLFTESLLQLASQVGRRSKNLNRLDRAMSFLCPEAWARMRLWFPCYRPGYGLEWITQHWPNLKGFLEYAGLMAVWLIDYFPELGDINAENWKDRNWTILNEITIGIKVAIQHQSLPLKISQQEKDLVLEFIKAVGSFSESAYLNYKAQHDSVPKIKEVDAPFIQARNFFLNAFGITQETLDDWQRHHRSEAYEIPDDSLSLDAVRLPLIEYTATSFIRHVRVHVCVLFDSGQPIAVDLQQNQIVYRINLTPKALSRGLRPLINVPIIECQLLGDQVFKGLFTLIGFPGTMPVNHSLLLGPRDVIDIFLNGGGFSKLNRYLVLGEGGLFFTAAALSHGATDITLRTGNKFVWAQALYFKAQEEEQLKSDRRHLGLSFADDVHEFLPKNGETYERIICFPPLFSAVTKIKGIAGLSQDPDGVLLGEFFKNIEETDSLAHKGRLILVYDNEEVLNRWARKYHWYYDPPSGRRGSSLQIYRLRRERDSDEDYNSLDPNGPTFTRGDPPPIPTSPRGKTPVVTLYSWVAQMTLCVTSFLEGRSPSNVHLLDSAA